MFWIFILVTTLALMLVKLGALSIMVTVLSAALYFALLIVVGLSITVLWQKVTAAKK